MTDQQEITTGVTLTVDYSPVLDALEGFGRFVESAFQGMAAAVERAGRALTALADAVAVRERDRRMLRTGHARPRSKAMRKADGRRARAIAQL